MKRYKEGFDRLGIVAFVFCAAVFGLVYLTSTAPPELPEPTSERQTAIELDVTQECGPDQTGILAGICRHRVKSTYQWRLYRDNANVWAFGVVVLAAMLLVGALFGRRIYRWVRDGFDRT